MKHLPTLLLALGLSAATLTAQNVTVYMKDGTTHKFNADRLSELKFRDVPQEQRMDVTFLQPEINVYSGGNANLAFKDEDGTVELTVDIYGPADASFLNVGTYTLSSENTPFTIDSNNRWTWLKINGEDKAIAAAEMYVNLGAATDAARFREQGVNPDHVYTIETVVTTEDNIKVSGKYVGELSSYTPWLTLALDKASYNENPQLPGTFYVKFSDPDYKCEMSLIFNADASATTLPAGTYTLSDFHQDGTISSASYVDLYRPNANLKLIAGSKVVVTRDGDNYTMDMDLNFNDGRTGDFTFSGQIAGTPTFETIEPEGTHFTAVSENIFSGGNVELTFSTADGQSLKLDMYGSETAVCLEPGEYIIGAETGFYVEPGYSEYRFTPEGGDAEDTKELKSGKVTVTEAEGVYTILFDITFEDDSTLKGWFEGELTKYGTLMRGTLTKAEYNDAMARPAGNMYIKFNDPDWIYTVGLNMFADPEATLLPAGTYTYGDRSTEPGTFDWNSYVDVYTGGSSTNNRMAEGSTVTVEEAEGVYTITMDMKFTSGRRAVLTYSGTISGAPVFE